MQLKKKWIYLGEVPSELRVNFMNKIIEDDWYSLDYRKNMFGLELEKDPYNSLLLRHSKTYSNEDVENMPLYNKYEDVLMPYIEWLKQHFEVEDFVAFAARLNPGGSLDVHVDNGDFLTTIHRVHFPIKTNKDANYIVGLLDENSNVIDVSKIHMPLDTAFEIDNQKPHGVENLGQEDRIHLIINIYGTPKTHLDKRY